MTIRSIIPICLMTLVAACSPKDKTVAPPEAGTEVPYTIGGCTTTFEPPSADTVSLKPNELPLPDADFESVHNSSECIVEPPLPPATDAIICCLPCEPMPQFPGGEKALIDFLEKNIQYPEAALLENKSGTVFVKFVVQADGKLTDFGIIGESPGFGMDEEALRVMKMMPDWEPGVLNGKPSATVFNLPIRFSFTTGKQ
ncbi:energy transducer TonB [Chitinophaga caseinilytica]|uniref:Energy transducer TonB n=1 Tax=Chitinophaga caseinilytica TaxID=2267521 RepID=A0ABZ2ZAB5_9BACT